MANIKPLTNDYKNGLKNSVVFGAAFIPLYLAIGMAGQKAARSFEESLSMTLFLFSTPLQFILTESKESFLVLAPLVLMMNARFLLFAANLAPHMGKTPFYKLLPSMILLCPSVFSACMVRFRNTIERPFHYFLAMGLPIWGISIICTIIGFFLAESLASPFWNEIMRLVLPLQFTMLAAKHWGEHFAVSSYVLGFFIAPVLFSIMGELGILFAPLFIGLIIVILEDSISCQKNKEAKKCGQ